jgi:uncharacterized protein YbjT (DUF2867 family)
MVELSADGWREARPVLVTGASGCLGGRLAPGLLRGGYRVRCVARSAGTLTDRPWASHPRAEITEANVGDVPRLIEVMRGCHAAYYLIHSMMMTGRGYRRRDEQLAQGFAQGATQSGLERIIYLGGLGETGSGLSEHQAFRREVEQALASGAVPVTVLHAAMIISSGSASFKILRYLVERLPVMITPRWVRTRCQPIAVRNVLHYLVACSNTPETTGKTLDIGGPEVLMYRRLMAVMAEARRLGRRLGSPGCAASGRLASRGRRRDRVLVFGWHKRGTSVSPIGNV